MLDEMTDMNPGGGTKWRNGDRLGNLGFKFWLFSGPVNLGKVLNLPFSYEKWGQQHLFHKDVVGTRRNI